MGETRAIQRNQAGPVTITSLVRDLRALGLESGMTVLVHSSLSRIGWVAGGTQAVVMALEEVLDPDGTLAVPTHSSELSDPAQWQNPPVPESWWAPIREEMPAFDPCLTGTRQMGAIANTVRCQPGTLRSYHPHTSFAARGPHAAYLTSNHELAFKLGEASPLARLYELEGWVLLLGVGHINNTSLHLAEARANFPGKKVVRDGGPILVEGERRWVTFDDLDWDESDFPLIGDAFDALGHTRMGLVGHAPSRLLPQRPLVDFAVTWMEENRRARS